MIYDGCSSNDGNASSIYSNDYDTNGNNIIPTLYTKALAFIPTGWADSGNYNKQHPMACEDGITVHTIPYSEHSNCPELVEFVKFLKPMEVIPTVYSDVSDLTFVLNAFHYQHLFPMLCVLVRYCGHCLTFLNVVLINYPPSYLLLVVFYLLLGKQSIVYFGDVQKLC